jgi:AraC family transcriptional regulator of adaptative response / DNA-3-methyladenine glycosylase II
LFKSRYGLSPRAIRGKSIDTDTLSVQLEFRPPLAWKSLLAYLRLRAIPGVETADDTHYRRTVAIGDAKGWIGVSMHASGNALNLEVSPTLTPVIGAIIGRVKQLFDLGAAPDSVSTVLRQDDILAATVRRLPGLRVAGAFDGFELAVRTVLGQQVSVKGASTLAGRWAQAFGDPIATPYPGLNRLTPSAERMTEVPAEQIAGLGMVGARARCLVGLAAAVSQRKIMLAYASNVEEQIDSLMRLPGIGHWTANYIAMRALHWPDAFPTGDLVLMRAARSNQKQLQRRSEAWRPWRAYAAHYLWQSSGVAL